MKHLIVVLALCTTFWASETYRFAAANQTPIVGINVTLCGSATRRMKLTRATFDIQNVSTTAAYIGDLTMNKRSTTDSAGTCTTPTIVSHDSTNTASTATFVRSNCTVAPTAGTLVGLAGAKKINLEQLAPLPANTTIDFVQGGVTTGIPTTLAQALTFKSNVECVDWSFPTVAGTPTYDVTIEWTEE